MFLVAGKLMRKSLRKLAAVITACSLSLVMAAGIMPNMAQAASASLSDAGKKAAKAKPELDAPEYHAYFGYQQQGSWTYRNAWYDPGSGKDSDYSTGSFDTLMTDGGNQALEGPVITDAVIKGNGTYSVSLTNIGGAIPADDTSNITSLLFISTDIPSKAMETISFSDVKLLVDGAEIPLPDELYVDTDAEEAGLYQLDLINTYHKESYEGPAIMMVNDSIEIQFTVSGFNVDDPDAVIAEPTEEPSSDAASTSSEASSNASSSGSTESGDESSSGGSSTVVIIVIVAVVVIAGAVVVLRKKK